MVQADFGPGIDLPKRLKKLEDAVQALSTRDILQNASIGNGGITVNGGQIHVTNGGSIVVDGSGTITLPTGAFSSGSVTTNALTVNGNSNTTGTATVGTLSATGGVSASGNVSAGGSGNFPSGVNSTGVYNNLLTSSYRVQYVWSGGDMGYVPSSRRFKQDITTAPDIKSAMLAMRVVTFRYMAAVHELGDAAAVEWGVIAEELDALGLRWAVDYDAEGLPFGVKYERLTLAVIPVIQDHEERLKAAGL